MSTQAEVDKKQYPHKYTSVDRELNIDKKKDWKKFSSTQSKVVNGGMHVIVTDCGAQEQLVAHNKHCVHKYIFSCTHKDRQIQRRTQTTGIQPSETWNGSLLFLAAGAALYLPVSFINHITSSFIHRYTIQSDRRVNAHTSGQITSNFLTQACWRLNEIRQPPTSLCTTSNFLM